MPSRYIYSLGAKTHGYYPDFTNIITKAEFHAAMAEITSVTLGPAANVVAMLVSMVGFTVAITFYTFTPLWILSHSWILASVGGVLAVLGTVASVSSLYYFIRQYKEKTAKCQAEMKKIIDKLNRQFAGRGVTWQYTCRTLARGPTQHYIEIILDSPVIQNHATEKSPLLQFANVY